MIKRLDYASIIHALCIAACVYFQTPLGYAGAAFLTIMMLRER